MNYLFFTILILYHHPHFLFYPNGYYRAQELPSSLSLMPYTYILTVGRREAGNSPKVVVAWLQFETAVPTDFKLFIHLIIRMRAPLNNSIQSAWEGGGRPQLGRSPSFQPDLQYSILGRQRTSSVVFGCQPRPPSGLDLWLHSYLATEGGQEPPICWILCTSLNINLR